MIRISRLFILIPMLRGRRDPQNFNQDKLKRMQLEFSSLSSVSTYQLRYRGNRGPALGSAQRGWGLGRLACRLVLLRLRRGRGPGGALLHQGARSRASDPPAGQRGGFVHGCITPSAGDRSAAVSLPSLSAAPRAST